VIITPSGESDWLPELLHLAQRGVNCSVLLLDRSTFAVEDEIPAPGNRGLRDAIQRLGLGSYIIKQGEVGVPSEHYGRRGHWEFKVTGTGKVITTQNPLMDVGRKLRK